MKNIFFSFSINFEANASGFGGNSEEYFSRFPCYKCPFRKHCKELIYPETITSHFYVTNIYSTIWKTYLMSLMKYEPMNYYQLIPLYSEVNAFVNLIFF